MKLLFLLAFVFWLISWAIPREAQPATGCAYPSGLDTFSNVSSGSILTAADYNKLLCAVESLEGELRIPNFTVATRPASPQIGRVIYVTDAIDATTCNTGGGSTRNVCVWNGTNWITNIGGGGGGAPTGASYITATSDGGLSAEFALGSLATGLLRNTTTTGVPTIAVEGTHYYAPGGTTIPLAGGGTGATTQAGAQTALAVTPGTNVFIQRTFQDQANVFTWTNGDGIAGNPTPLVANSLIDGSSRFAADSGSSDDYAACPRSISTLTTPAYVDQSIHGFRANTANTGAATINYCSIGSRALVKLVGGVNVPLATGDVLVGQPVLTVFHAANNQFQIISTLASGAGGGTGTPAGPTNSCQYNAAGVLGGDAGCTYDSTTDQLSIAGGVNVGTTATNSVEYVMGGGISGHKTYTASVNADGEVGVTTGTKTSGDYTKFAADGSIVRGGTANRTFQFMLGAENGAVLVDGDDQPSIFYNHLGQGITINSVWCQSDAGTPSINLQKDDGSPANILSSNLSCATGTGTTTTTFSGTEYQIASTNRVNLVMVTAGGVAKRITVSVRYSLD